MHPMSHLLCIALLGAALPCSAFAQPSIDAALPPRLQAKLERREHALNQHLPGSIGLYPRDFVQRDLRLWEPGSTLAVTFFGGSYPARKSVETLALQWTREVNLELRFVDVLESGLEGRASELRIAFERGSSWSLVGTDALDPALVAPDEPSLCIGLDQKEVGSPRWNSLVLHLLGHALGFEDESPSASLSLVQALRLQDDVGYVRTKKRGIFVTDSAGRRPGIYTMFSGAPHFWTAPQVDARLRDRAPTQRLHFGPKGADAASVMTPLLPEWMLRDGRNNPLFQPHRGELSPGDLAALRAAYPDPGPTLKAQKDRRLRFLVRVARAPVSPELREHWHRLGVRLRTPGRKLGALAGSCNPEACLND